MTDVLDFSARSGFFLLGVVWWGKGEKLDKIGIVSEWESEARGG